ncbi:hypothetical protein AK830_g5395 [Neonectria ditissima]|uniref:Uncharacterized protein n=1 Tax=Neonectria ditissima TaxID=78410 RepID=A0A0P7BEF2_9HYPO|nr:hypothetical protein AK830_g5395 [Neonectria ditissima]
MPSQPPCPSLPFISQTRWTSPKVRSCQPTGPPPAPRSPVCPVAPATGNATAPGRTAAGASRPQCHYAKSRREGLDREALAERRRCLAVAGQVPPAVVPSTHLARLLQDPNTQASLTPLLAVLRFIGHLYDTREWSNPLQDSVDACLSQAPQVDPFMVQCRLLYSIPLFWYRHTADSKREMDAAIQLCPPLGNVPSGIRH